MRLFLPRARPAPLARRGPRGDPSLRCPSGRAGGGRRSGRRDFLSGRGAEGSRCQPRRPPPPPLPLGGGVSPPGGGRRAGRGFLSEDAQGSGRRCVSECVSVCRPHGVARAAGSASPRRRRRRRCCRSRWKSMCSSSASPGINMATSLHEGPTNQLDLLIRAGKGRATFLRCSGAAGSGCTKAGCLPRGGQRRGSVSASVPGAAGGDGGSE